MNTTTTKYERKKESVENSFELWINQYSDSGHPCDKERFLKFVRHVCIFSASKWKRSEYLEKRIVEKKPNFDKYRLECLLIAYEYLTDFYKTLKNKS